MAIVTAVAYVPNAAAALAAIFEAATPDHWCAVPELADLTKDQQRRLSAPPGEGGGGYDGCQMYDVSNYSLLVQQVNVTEQFSVSNQPKTVDCTDFVYDTSVYKSTIVAEVGKTAAPQTDLALNTLLVVFTQPC